MPRVAVPRVLIADDHVPTRDVLGDCLRAAGLDIVAEAGTAAEAVDAAVARAPDLCLLDVCMPGNGVDAARDISRRLPGTKIVMLTAFPDSDGCAEAVSAGAEGYLAKDMDGQRLAHVLREVLAGRPAIPRAYTGVLIAELRKRRSGRALWPRHA